MAAAANQPLIVEDLLNLGAEPNATDHRGRSVLHVAATYGLPRVLLVCLFGRWDEWDGLDCLDPEFQGYMAWRDSKPALCLLLQAVINSGVRVDIEARDFEGKLNGGQGVVAGGAGSGECSRYRVLTVSVLQASPHSTQPSWPSTWLCAHLTYIPQY